MKKKLIIIFASLIIVVFAIVSILIYYMYMNSVKKKALSYTIQLTDQISVGINNYLEEIDRITLTPFYNDKVMSILEKHINSNSEPLYVPVSEYTFISYYLSTLAYDRPEVKDIIIFSNDGIVFGSSSGNDGYKDIDLDKEWMKYEYNESDKIFIMPPHKDKYFNRNVFSVVRPIKSLYENELIGMIKINLDMDAFNKIISSTHISEHTKIIITDENRNIFFPEDTETNLLISSDYDYIEMDGQKYIYSEMGSDMTGLIVIGLVPLSDMEDEAMSLVNSIAYLLLLILIATIIVVYIIATRIVKPVKHLIDKMELVQNGNIWIEADVMSRDEIGELAFGFNKMIVRIRGLMTEVGELVKEVYVRKIKERDAQIFALQSMINPHFFYNTLEVINMIAVENDQYDICNITSNLGKLLRYSIDMEQRPVPLSEEIKFVKAYYIIILNNNAFLTNFYPQKL